MPACPDCSYPQLTKSKKGGWLCEDCNARFTEGDVNTPVAAGLDDLPFPVAFPLHHGLDASVACASRIDNLIFTAYQAMRVTGLVLLADYLACDAICRRLEGGIRGLQRPHWVDWSTLCDQLCSFWNGHYEEKPGRASHFPQLVAGWCEFNRRHGAPAEDSPWASHIDGLPGLQGKAQSPNDAIWTARNDRSHRMATRTVDERADASLEARLAPLLQAALPILFPVGSLSLWRAVDAASDRSSAIRLHGAHPDLHFEPQPAEAWIARMFATSRIVAACGEMAVPVFPLMVPFDPESRGHELGGGGLVEHVTLIDGIKGEKSVVVLGVQSHAEIPELVGPVKEALGRKQVELGFGRDEAKRWTLVEWASTTARETVGRMLGYKYFPECYVERPGADDTVARCLERGGKGLLMLGEAGSGKSSLLARLVERLLDEKEDEAQAPRHRGKGDALDRYLESRGQGDVVLYLAGRDGYASDSTGTGRTLLCDSVMRRAGIRDGTFTDLTDFVTRLAETAGADTKADRKVWIVLDGFNESSRFRDLLSALDDFLPQVAKYRWLRLVVSMRAGAYHSLRRQEGEFLANARFLFHFSDELSKKEEPWLALRPFTLSEAERAYERWQTELPERAARIEYAKMSPQMRELLRSPLHLHVFHETYRGRDVAPAELDESELFEAYLDGLAASLPSLNETLAAIGREMMQRCRPELPLHVADEWVKVWRAGKDGAAAVARLDPVEELVAASLLMRPAEEGVGVDRRLVSFVFSHQKLCEQVLLRDLLRRIAPRVLPEPGEMLAFARQAAGHVADGDAVSERGKTFPELANAVARLATRLVDAGKVGPLAVLLDVDDDDTTATILGAAIRRLGSVWGPTREGSEEGRTVLEGLRRKGLEGRLQAVRFWGSALLARKWLVRSGSSLAAEAVDRARLELLRAFDAAGAELPNFGRALASTLVDLGSLLMESARLEEARRFFEESTDVLTDLVNAEPHDPDLRTSLASAWTYLGEIARKGGRDQDARRHFLACLEISQSLVAEDSGRSDSLHSLASAKSSLGYIAMQAGETEEARTCYQEAITILRLLARETQNETFLQHLSTALDVLGNLARMSGRMGEAESLFDESLEIAKALEASDPTCVEFRKRLAVSLNSRAVLAQANRQTGLARRYFEEMRTIVRELVTREPHQSELRHSLCVALMNEGVLAREGGENDRAESMLVEACDHLRELLALEPDRSEFRFSLAVALKQRGEIARSARRDTDEWAFFSESCDLFRRLSSTEPGRSDVLAELASSLNRLGNLAWESTRFEEAKRCFHEEVGVRRSQAALAPSGTEAADSLATALDAVAQIVWADGRVEEASQLLEESVSILQSLMPASDRPPDIERRLLPQLAILSQLAREQKRSDDEKGFVRAYLDVLRSLAKAFVELTNSGHAARQAGRIEEATRSFGEALDLIRSLVAAEPRHDDFRRDLAVSLGNLGDVTGDAGRIAEAMALFEEALEVMQALVSSKPERADFQLELAVSWWRIFRTESANSKRDRALREVFECIRPLKESGMEDFQLEELWTLACQQSERKEADFGSGGVIPEK